jgi:phosphomannomutase
MNKPSYRPELAALLQGYDILGKTGRNLLCRQVIPLANAFGNLLSPEGGAVFAIGHDVRASSPSVAEAASVGLWSGNHHVIHIGACTTPQLEWYAANAKLRGALMITGGDKPREWNGIRLYGPGAEPVPAAAVVDAIETYDLNELLSTLRPPLLRHDRPQPAYAAWLRQRLRLQRHIKLCLDIGNGMAGAELESILAHFPQLRVWRIGFEPNPAFTTRGPDPFALQARTGVAKCVLANGCHLGAALTADGERLAVTDDRGRPVAPHTVGVLLALARAPDRPGLRVLHDGHLTEPAADALRRAGIATQSTEDGTSAAWSALHAGRADLYFNRTGHYAFGDFPGSANALLALAVLVNYLAERDTPLSMLAGSVSVDSDSAS